MIGDIPVGRKLKKEYRLLKPSSDQHPLGTKSQSMLRKELAALQKILSTPKQATKYLLNTEIWTLTCDSSIEQEQEKNTDANKQMEDPLQTHKEEQRWGLNDDSSVIQMLDNYSSSSSSSSSQSVSFEEPFAHVEIWQKKIKISDYLLELRKKEDDLSTKAGDSKSQVIK